MGLSFGIPLALTIVVADVVLFLATDYKKIAKVTLGTGVTVV